MEWEEEGEGFEGRGRAPADRQVCPEYKLPNPATSGGTTVMDTGRQPDRAGRNTIGHGEDKIEAREDNTATKSGEGWGPKTS